MTDYSKMTDQELNEAIFKAKGWVFAGKLSLCGWYRDTSNGRESLFDNTPPDYTHDWRLCGELLEEMGNAISDGWEFSCEHSDVDGLEPLKWRVWMTRFTDNVEDFMSIHAEGDDFIRTVDEAWLAWKDITNYTEDKRRSE